jgi:sigma-E factor negative regulatory protein RseA
MGVKIMQDKISAMMDGELDEHGFAQLLAAIDEDDACADTWRDYHLISDAMNCQTVMSADFMDRFSERLAAEPVVIAPGAMRRRHVMANPRWAALSMAASVALVSATAWYVGRGSIAVAPPVEVQVAANQASVDADVSPYLLAHQAMIGNPGFSHRPVILTGADANQAVAVH